VTITCTRLERLLRVLWTMSLDGDLRAMRCLLEYMEGRPVQVVAAAMAQEGEARVSADELAKLLAGALERVEAWRNASDGNDTRNG
jgi:hypothetical protein